MRNVRTSRYLVVCLISSLLLFAACKDFEKNTYRSLYSVGTTYNLTMKTVSVLQEQGQITDEQRAEINTYADYFYVAYQAAVDAFEIYKKTKMAVDKERLQTALLTMFSKWESFADYVNRIAPGTAQVSP